MKIFTPLLLIAIIVGSILASPPFADTNATYEKSVIMIRSVKQSHNPSTPWKQNPMSEGIGSGFVIAGDRILTNAHNVSDYKYVQLKKQNQAKRYQGIVTFVGHDCDLAIIKPVEPGFFSDCIELEIGELPKINSTVQTYGFPVGGKHISVTEGVVSRIQTDNYSHTQADAHLVVQTDAAINPGNSGGPVIQDGKVVGVAFQGLRQADNIGYMIPTTVIDHFLKDIEDDKYDGFGSLGFSFYAGLHSKSYADYLKLPAGKEGIVVLDTMLNSSVENVFEHGDVITSIDNYEIDNDGMITIHGLNLHMSEAIEQKQVGQIAKIVYYRQGKEMAADAEIALNRPPLAFWRQYDKPPRYVVYAGLTFVPVGRNFLETWGRKWLTDLPFGLRHLFMNSSDINDDPLLKEYVVMSEILPDEINSYADGFKNMVVVSVNGNKIRSLDDLAKEVNAPDKDFCTIRFMGNDQPLIIDAVKAKERNQVIVEKFQLPAQSYLKD